MTPEQTRLNKYYLKTFGWSLEEVDTLFASQGGVCAACGRPPGKYRLSLDHDHAFDRIKLIIERLPDWNWAAFLNKTDASCIAIGITKKEARENGRRALRRKSVRGLLCSRCNRGLAMFEDSKAPLPPAERLEKLAAYLRKFSSRSEQAHHEESICDSDSVNVGSFSSKLTGNSSRKDAESASKSV